jgi:hypothetical protein
LLTDGAGACIDSTSLSLNLKLWHLNIKFEP